MEGNTSALS
jgi:serine/threonine protein kinase